MKTAGNEATRTSPSTSPGLHHRHTPKAPATTFNHTTIPIMTTIPYGFLLKALFALFLGFWIASRLQGLLRAMVIRMMPVRYRMSEEYFNIQTRISMAVAVAIGLGIAALTYWGIGKAGSAITGPIVSRSSTVEIEPTPAPPLAAPSWEPEESPAPSDTLPTREDTPQVSPASSSEPALPETYEEPKPVRISSPPPPANPYYLQLYAFVSETRAWQQKAHWASRLPRSIHVGIDPGGAVPYKVLAGPFNSRQQAIEFRKKHKLASFPRQLGQIRLYE